MQNVFIIYGQNGMCTLHVVLCVRLAVPYHAMPGVQCNVFRMYESKTNSYVAKEAGTHVHSGNVPKLMPEKRNS